MTGMMKTKINPTAVFKPLEWQIKPFRNKSKVMLLTGSAGGGKSRLAAEKVHAFMLKYSGATGLLVRKTRDSARKSMVNLMKYRVIQNDPAVNLREARGYFEYANGSLLFWGGMKDEEQREAVRSMGQDGCFDIVWGEEANKLREKDHNELITRLRGTSAPWRQLIYTTNPDHPKHWINNRLIGGGEAKVFYSSADMNPHNPADYVNDLNNVTGVQYLRLVKGLWVQAEGVVYPEWTPETHIVDRFIPPDNWAWYAAVDFGFTNPFVFKLYAQDPDGRLYLTDEIYYTKRTVRRHCEDIKTLIKGKNVIEWICDHDAENRATLEEELGIKTRPADKHITDGIEAVRERLKVQEDGKPRLFYMRDALYEEDPLLTESGKPVCSEDEFTVYSYPDGIDGRPIKEAPMKEHDHGMDCDRYMVMHFDSANKRKPATAAIGWEGWF